MRPETAIALRNPIPAAVSRLELQRLSALHAEGRTKPWLTLSVGIDLVLVKAKKANAYYVLMLGADENETLGYLLVTKNKVTVQTTVIKGWTVLHTYLEKTNRGLGFMHRVYDTMIAKGRLITAPTHTPKAMAMWVNRIKTDNRNLYLLVNGDYTVPVTPRTVDSLRRTIWDGDPKTVLVCAPKTDVKIKKLMTVQSAKLDRPSRSAATPIKKR